MYTITVLQYSPARSLCALQVILFVVGQFFLFFFAQSDDIPIMMHLSLNTALAYNIMLHTNPLLIEYSNNNEV